MKEDLVIMFAINSHKRSANSHRGLSLVSFMFALGILSVGAKAFAEFFVNRSRFEQILQMRADKVDIRNFIINKTDCEKTFNPLPIGCSKSAKPYIRLRDEKGKIIVDVPSEKPTIIGRNYFVRALCLPCKNCGTARKIKVEVAVVNSSAKVTKESTKETSHIFEDLYAEDISPGFEGCY